ncbi:MAG: hypothetical protein LBH00_04995 [Planctomycetaceae bacterium]|nr:hypothetical protein [Planctomycetaceae bacterium]
MTKILPIRQGLLFHPAQSCYPCVLEHVRQHETGGSVIIKLEHLPETRTTTFLISHKQGRVHDRNLIKIH